MPLLGPAGAGRETGGRFPYALAAGAVGATTDIPVLLVAPDFEQCLGLPSDPAAGTASLPPAPKE